jgi:hypothetical protein
MFSDQNEGQNRNMIATKAFEKAATSNIRVREYYIILY